MHAQLIQSGSRLCDPKLLEARGTQVEEALNRASSYRGTNLAKMESRHLHGHNSKPPTTTNTKAYFLLGFETLPKAIRTPYQVSEAVLLCPGLFFPPFVTSLGPWVAQVSRLKNRPKIPFVWCTLVGGDAPGLHSGQHANAYAGFGIASSLRAPSYLACVGVPRLRSIITHLRLTLTRCYLDMPFYDHSWDSTRNHFSFESSKDDTNHLTFKKRWGVGIWERSTN